MVTVTIPPRSESTTKTETATAETAPVRARVGRVVIVLVITITLGWFLVGLVSDDDDRKGFNVEKCLAVCPTESEDCVARCRWLDTLEKAVGE